MGRNWREAQGYGTAGAPERGMLRRFWSWLMYTEPKDTPPLALRAPKTLPPGRREQIEEALREWQAATAYFENVTDPALVDYAVFDMEAAQKRYMYLLKGAGKP